MEITSHSLTHTRLRWLFSAVRSCSCVHTLSDKMDTSVLSELSLTSKDSKILLPALVSFFQNFENKFVTMFTDMKQELLAKIDERDSTISELKGDVTSLQEKVKKLEYLIDESDAYERRDTIILNGPAVPSVTPQENCSILAQDLVKNEFRLNMSSGDISTAHRLGAKPRSQGPDNRAIIVKLCQRDLKRTIIMASKSHQGSKRLFANESLTPRRRKIFNTLRSMKRQHPDLVKGVSTQDGKIFAYTRSPTAAESSRDTRHLVNTYESMINFCREHVKKPIENFLDSWNFQ